jgi:hypothetical protein
LNWSYEPIFGWVCYSTEISGIGFSVAKSRTELGCIEFQMILHLPQVPGYSGMSGVLFWGLGARLDHGWELLLPHPHLTIFFPTSIGSFHPEVNFFSSYVLNNFKQVFKEIQNIETLCIVNAFERTNKHVKSFRF